VLYHILLGILKPGKPAGSARVLICNRCHHKLIIFTRCKDTKKIWILPYFEPLFFNFCILLVLSALQYILTFNTLHCFDLPSTYERRRNDLGTTLRKKGATRLTCQVARKWNYYSYIQGQ
jgi:hypothetical protein